MDLRTFQREVHQNALQHGWWDQPRSFGDVIALCHSELSEALEAFRDGEPMSTAYTDDWTEPTKPEGVAIEMADVIIRILDWAERNSVDMSEMLHAKHEYNKSRSYRHGGKAL